MTENTAPKTEMTDLQRKALELLAYNKPLNSSITKRTLNSLIKKGWATLDANTYWISAEGRKAVGIASEWERKPKETKPKTERKAAPRKQPQECRCGCGEMTGGGNYRPGHDARHAGQVVLSAMEGNDLEALIDLHFFDTPRLEEKVRKNYKLAMEREAKKAARAAAKEQAK
ncbi:hypothetical protein SEA_ARCHIMEDES_47 [Gordonia phage Archimedes]|uniref:Uncharacterized protein n=1 Tax=Gordonia phage Archimedes TaxID=2759389 RepID=A0A7L7SNM7_9CAUD|nr:hypothetical protein KCH38_gp47 [Gordonia phage Archimedes]QOC55747.1 hypothetical protein SEA_ARCHIMEDES_47 [Gordonia phage Archimedes]